MRLAYNVVAAARIYPRRSIARSVSAPINRVFAEMLGRAALALGANAE
jgi:hypothetical protein